MSLSPRHRQPESLRPRQIGLAVAFALTIAGCRVPDAPGATDTDVPQPETKMTDEPDSPRDALPPNVDVELWKRGVDFFADGTNPAWSLTMDFDGSFVFTPTEGTPRRVKAAKPDRAQDAEVTRYRSVTDELELLITVRGLSCESRPSLTHRVSVDVEERGPRGHTSYQGCGRYVIDPRLNDIWALTATSEQTVDPRRLPKGPPVLELHLRDRRVLGHTGCSSFQGSFAIVRPGAIRFSPLVTKRAHCPDAEVEEILLAMLSGRELRYSLRPGRLSLEDPSGGRLEYRKVD